MNFDKPVFNSVILRQILKEENLRADEADPIELSKKVEGSFSNCDPERIRELLETVERPMLSCKSARDIDFNQTPEIRFFIAGMLSEGLTLLNAPSKGGKSRLLLQMALSLCFGENFLGRQCKKTSVLYMPLEDYRVDFENRLKLFLQDRDPPENLYYLIGEDFGVHVPTLNRGQLIPLLQNAMLEHPDIEVVMIDVFGLIRSEQQKGEDFMKHERRDLLTLVQFASKHRIAMIVAHHVSNTSKRTGKLSAIGSGAGSYVVSGTVHAEMLISPKGEHGERIFSCEGRRIPEQKIALLDDFPRWKYGGSKEDFETANDPLIQTIRFLVDGNGGKWRGSSKQIMEEIPHLGYTVNRNTFSPAFCRKLGNTGISYRSIKNGSGVLHEFKSIKAASL